ncbi:MAG: UvrD/REP helicase [Bacteroidetes bacterium]|nr:MAG: UvrD/REP helicase [Bacteroidota bacterium]
MPLNVYKSSAGSGKTFTLVLEYLLLVLKQPGYYRHILAVTFTNKAANEMKSRIITALYILSDEQLSNHKQYKTLVNQLAKRGFNDEGLIRRNASLVFSSILHHYSDFSISTIDSFTHKIVKTFSRDLRLPSVFEVELNDSVLTQEVVNELINKVGSDDYVTTVIIEFILEKLSDETDWRIDRSLRAYAKELIGEEAFLEMNKIDTLEQSDVQSIKNQLTTKIFEISARFISKSSAILKLLNKAGLSPFDLVGKTKGIGLVLIKLSEGEIADVFKGKTILNSFESDNPFIAKSTPQPIKNAFESVAEEVTQNFDEIRESYENFYPRYVLFQLLRKNIYAFVLQSHMLEIIHNLIDKKQLVHISEFNKRLADLLQMSPVAFIYERLGEKYRSFLLDEFQDTSVLQWQNFLPLIENSLASGYENLIVGDGKQSIYRFRGGEFQQFLKLPFIHKLEDRPHLERIENLIKQQYHEQTLDTNYRSSSDVVEFNNDFFEFIQGQLPLQLKTVFEGQRQKVFNDEKCGLVQFDFFISTEGKEIKTLAILERILLLIEKQLNDGYSLNDITVLVSGHHEGDEVARFLSSRNIEVVSADSLLLNSSASVRLSLNLLTFYLLPENKINRLELLVNLMEINPLYFTNGTTEELLFYNDLDEKSQISYIKMKSNWIEQQPGKGLYDITEELLRSIHLDKYPDPYIQFFLDEIHRFQVQEQKGLNAFLDYWKEEGGKKSVVIPEKTNAVKVMTIHKAKGLEFPVVIFPFANRFYRGTTRKNIWLDLRNEEVEKLTSGFVSSTTALSGTAFGYLYEEETEKTKLDMMNLLYVAFTRAISRLYVLADLPMQKNLSYPLIFKEYLQFKELWSDEKLSYVFGDETKSVSNKRLAISDNTRHHDFFISSGWMGRLILADESVIEQKASVTNEDKSYGLLIHEVLSQIVSFETFRNVLSHYESTGYLTNNQVNDFARMIESFRFNSVLEQAFSDGSYVRTETELLNAQGNIFRMDRFVELADRVIILDYKTGKQENHHIRQMENYIEIAKDLQTKPVDGYLLYLNDLINWEMISVS